MERCAYGAIDFPKEQPGAGFVPGIAKRLHKSDESRSMAGAGGGGNSAGGGVWGVFARLDTTISVPAEVTGGEVRLVLEDDQQIDSSAPVVIGGRRRRLLRFRGPAGRGLPGPNRNRERRPHILCVQLRVRHEDDRENQAAGAQRRCQGAGGRADGGVGVRSCVPDHDSGLLR